ncbi:MAG: hypothetical protein ACFFDN_33690 [Candidatus Hodarchaeota archaeon]
MENNYRKWLVMGIIGLILMTGFPILLIVTAYNHQYASIFRPTFDMNPCQMCIMILLSENEDIADYGYLALWCFQIVQSASRRLVITRITFFSGISLAILAGILILVGWIQFSRLKREK